MRPRHVQEMIDHLISQLMESDERMELGVSYRYVSDYYRLNSELPIEEDNRKVVLNSLQTYPDVGIRIRMDEISDDYHRVLTRDTLRSYSDWAYRYGSEGRDIDDMRVPDVEGSTNTICKVVCELNDKIREKSEYTVNDAALALTLSGEIADSIGFENLNDDIFNSDEYKQVRLITEEIQSFVHMKDDGRLHWNMMAKTFDEIRNQTHQDIMENVGKRQIIHELKDSDTDSITVFLENRID